MSGFGYAGFDPRTRQLTLDTGNNPFAGLLGQLGTASLYNAGSANSSPYLGANQNLIDTMGGVNSDLEAARLSANADGRPDSAEAQTVLNQFRAVAAPQEQRDRVALDNADFGRGMLGSTGGAERLRALTEAQGQNDLGRQVAATQFAQANADQRFNRANITASGRFDRALGTVNQGMANQAQQFGIGTSSLNSMQGIFQQLLSQAGLGVAAGGGQAPSAAINAANQAGAVPAALGDAFGQVAGAYFNRPQQAAAAPSGGGYDYGGYGVLAAPPPSYVNTPQYFPQRAWS